MNLYSDPRLYLADKNAPYCSLNVEASFAQLAPKERLYAHYIGRASWHGARIVQNQVSPWSADIYDMLIGTFSDKSRKSMVDIDALKKKSGLNDADWEAVVQWSGQVRPPIYKTYILDLIHLRSYRPW
jgi:dipeptidyl-peptidase-3